ncbi:class I SAM-dependent methyltransferase [Candidatus Woesearchaeota archaeon]|jgi:ubiquinone/menaquinone biosynthesis C-methylase UbiE|nr:class I SAM-dependent methyltransferase [Candidatus Woesearchaeota archaeon]MBT4367784.1 class I SAM-dependent methyltransferase [Candidatus Woesearchaeota archaeon]MBT4712272.1 class I SAM-dependent methyltransferase [Candidatus Woesearchaeota archaeon]MBT6638820.1 class I SAM-dependent methyltransferase [Candidatus Woesearchaeota archaeon]MBT7134464.1 class I SAM-dependent methyltransferase [Candidatus Woesearchaeota archaeon]
MGVLRTEEDIKLKIQELKNRIKNNPKVYGSFLKFIKGPNVLEIGCAVGHVLNFIDFNIDNLKLFGADIEEDMVNVAKDFFPKARYSLIEKASVLPFEDNFFDSVLLIHVAHEIQSVTGYEEFKKSVKEIYRTTKKGGKIIIRDFIYLKNNLVVDSNHFDLNLLKEFQEGYKKRQVSFKELNNGLINLSAQDFFEFNHFLQSHDSKKSSFEMYESHFSISSEEYFSALSEAGFVCKIKFVSEPPLREVIEGQTCPRMAIIIGVKY